MIFIKTPDDLGICTEVSISQLVRNVGGLINYVELLSTGDGRASKIGGPLGDSFFLTTGAKCKESFESYNLNESSEFPFPDDTFDQLYFAGLGGLGVYILYKLMEKSK